MKGSFLKSLILVALTASLTYIVTTKVSPGVKQSTKAIKKTTLSDTGIFASTLYPLDSAKLDIGAYLSVASTCNPADSLVRAYTIHSIDLFDAMGMHGHYVDSAYCKYKYVRVYLGYRSGSGYKLFIVPVDSFQLGSSPGIDLMLDSSGRPNPAGRFVLDLITPCPSVCDNTSPLMPLSQSKK